MEAKKLSLQEMEVIEGGSWACVGSVAGFVFGAGALITLNAATMGVGTFIFAAAGGWYGVIKGARAIDEHCLG